MLDSITPVILTLNEATNIARTLERLSWARDIVVVDSGSCDGTCREVKSYSNTRLFHRKFDSHAQQWNFAIANTEIHSDWTLALDADHAPTDELINELAILIPKNEVNGYRIRFYYCVRGQRLHGSLYPPLISLYRTGHAEYVQQGHTQRIRLQGAIGQLHGRMLHDDRKPWTDWLVAQHRYMKLEAKLISATPWQELSATNRLRRFLVLAPFAALLWSLLIKGTLLDGPAGWFYSAQRMLAEILLSLQLIYDLRGYPEKTQSLESTTSTAPSARTDRNPAC